MYLKYMLTPVDVMSMKVLSIAIFLMLFILPLPAQQEAWPWVDDGVLSDSMIPMREKAASYSVTCNL